VTLLVLMEMLSCLLNPIGRYKVVEKGEYLPIVSPLGEVLLVYSQTVVLAWVFECSEVGSLPVLSPLGGVGEC
jgi:hypothetical protein